MLGTDAVLGVEVLLLDVEVGDFVSEVLGLDRDRGQEVGQRAAVGHAEFPLHLLSCLPTKESRVPLAADAGEALVVLHSIVNDAGQGLFRARQLLAGGQPLDFAQSLLDEFLLASLEGEVRLVEGDLVLAWIAVLGDQVAGIAGPHRRSPAAPWPPDRPFS